MRPEGYYNHARPEVLALVPEDARRILDVGCGAGELGAAIKARQGAYVCGIERDGAAGHAADAVLDYVRHADVETGQLPHEIIGEGFDCIVFADILEHLEDPEALLRYAGKHWLADTGTLVVSVPNSRHWSVLEALVNGDYPYTDAGLMDRTHLRLFTRREVQKLLWRAGFEVVGTQAVLMNERPPQGRTVQAGRFSFVARDQREAAEFSHYQYLLTARKRPAVEHGATSIIIPVWNQLAYTQQCLRSLAETTDSARTEIIVVDNGSTDGTGQWLKGEQQRHLTRSGGDGLFQIISNPENLGFAKACNQGLAAALYSNLLLLNNDVILCTGWLDRLLVCLHSAPGVGLAGPVSNNVSGPQQVPVPYNSLAEVEGYGWDWGLAHAGEYAHLDRLVGFCLAIKREVVERIGILDERFGLGTYEDDDYCRRAREAGYANLVARDCFVHHFAGRTFAGNGVDMMKLQAANAEVYAEKWGAG